MKTLTFSSGVRSGGKSYKELFNIADAFLKSIFSAVSYSIGSYHHITLHVVRNNEKD